MLRRAAPRCAALRRAVLRRMHNLQPTHPQDLTGATSRALGVGHGPSLCHDSCQENAPDNWRAGWQLQARDIHVCTECYVMCTAHMGCAVECTVERAILWDAGGARSPQARRAARAAAAARGAGIRRARVSAATGGPSPRARKRCAGVSPVPHGGARGRRLGSKVREQGGICCGLFLATAAMRGSMARWQILGRAR